MIFACHCSLKKLKYDTLALIKKPILVMKRNCNLYHLASAKKELSKRVLENTVSNWRTMKSLTQQLARSKREEEEEEEEDFAHFSQTERFEKETRRKRRRRRRSTPCEAAVNTRPWTVFIESFCILDSRTSWFIIITEISRFHSSTVLHGWENSWMDRKK